MSVCLDKSNSFSFSALSTRYFWLLASSYVLFLFFISAGFTRKKRVPKYVPGVVSKYVVGNVGIAALLAALLAGVFSSLETGRAALLEIWVVLAVVNCATLLSERG
jgi:hypothetical protein